LFELTQEQLKSLKNGYLITDGTLQYNKYENFVQSDKNRIEDFQLICFLQGETANIKEYKRKNKTHVFPNGHTSNIKPIKYYCNVKKNSSLTEARNCRMNYDKLNETIKVWCPQTNNKTWIAKRNGYITITGNTAKGLGTNVEKIQNMTGVQQLDYVYKFFKPYVGRIKSAQDLYMVTFFPAAMGKDDDFILQTKDLSAETIASQNKVVDLNHDNQITKGEFDEYVTKGLPKSWRQEATKKFTA
jgi:hypothetical protein